MEGGVGDREEEWKGRLTTSAGLGGGGREGGREVGVDGRVERGMRRETYVEKRGFCCRLS